MRLIRRLLAAALILTMISGMALQASAAGETVKSCISKLLSACANGQEEKADGLLEQMEEIDPEQAEVWREITERWEWINQDMEVNEGVLPDGLPEDDSLCIVVMGFCLNRNGSVKPELIDRLKVAIRSAEKYPNAYILCTGGPTASGANTTEAEQMGQWLAANGIEEGRILLEKKSLSTTENAQYTYAYLREEYPQVHSVAVVTSDYHIYRSCLVFDAMSIYTAAGDEEERIDVVANAVCLTNGGSETLYMQARELAAIAGVYF